tara:strand:- start:293 stop:466 length:174 start_codon:yes stop_codon:yes gene_type:complete
LININILYQAIHKSWGVERLEYLCRVVATKTNTRVREIPGLESIKSPIEFGAVALTE